MKRFLLKFFTWWNGQTLNTQLWTWLYGEFVGTDEFGNRYYRTKGGKIDPVLRFERRWVMYSGYAEASLVGPNWLAPSKKALPGVAAAKGMVPFMRTTTVHPEGAV